MKSEKNNLKTNEKDFNNYLVPTIQGCFGFYPLSFFGFLSLDLSIKSN